MIFLERAEPPSTLLCRAATLWPNRNAASCRTGALASISKSTKKCACGLEPRTCSGELPCQSFCPRAKDILLTSLVALKKFFFRATTNAKVKETVALELSYVNSSLQLLKEELEDLNSNVEVYQTERSGHGRATAPFRVRRLKPPLFPLHSEAAKAPMIPLGLKETKEADLAAPIQVKTPPPPVCRSLGGTTRGALLHSERCRLAGLHLPALRRGRLALSPGDPRADGPQAGEETFSMWASSFATRKPKSCAKSRFNKGSFVLSVVFID